RTQFRWSKQRARIACTHLRREISIARRRRSTPPRACRHSAAATGLAGPIALMPPDYIERLLAAWRADSGLVSSPPVGCRPQGFWAELECAFLNTYQVRWQYAAAGVGIGFAQGKSMLYRRSQIEQAGGIRSLATEPAEDAATTKLVRGLGLRVCLVDAPFSQPLGYRSAREVWARQLRWARLRQASFKRYYALEILSGGIGPLLAA